MTLSDIDVYAQQIADSNATAKALVDKNRSEKQLFLDTYYNENVSNSEILKSGGIEVSRTEGGIALKKEERSMLMTATHDEIKFKIWPYPTTDVLPLMFLTADANGEAAATREISTRIFNWLRPEDKKKS